MLRAGKGSMDTSVAQTTLPYSRLARLLWVVLAWGTCGQVAFAATVFGPETFSHPSREATVALRRFAVTDPSATYTIHVQIAAAPESTPDHRHARADAFRALVLLNGRTIVAPWRAVDQTQSIDRPVKLRSANVLKVALYGEPGGQLTVEVVSTGANVDHTPPTIDASIDPPPNAAGWNATDVTVVFVCADSGSGVATCPAPVPVTAEGAGQSISGTATDRAGNSAQTAAVVNLDKTAPLVTVQSPASGATLTAASAAVSGTASDALSGIDQVTCNGSTAALSGSNFTCAVPLMSGSNAIAVRATDRAGNVQTVTLQVTSAPEANFTVGGSITGLTGTGLVLQNNGADSVAPAPADSSFTFPTRLASGAAYAVTVQTQPANPAQLCVVSGGAGTVGSADVTSVAIACTDVAALPKTRNLIAQALADGRIDYATSLVYRMWALFLDAQLPPEYDGRGLGAEDTTLFPEIHRHWDTLPLSAQAALQPYLLRPTDPDSPFTATAAPAIAAQARGAGTQRRAAAVTAQSSQVECPSWSSANASIAYVKVWVCQSTDTAQTLYIQSKVIEILDRHWNAMVADMGAPRPDDGTGGDDRIDVYVLNLQNCVMRDGVNCSGITQDDSSEPSLAEAITTDAAAAVPGGTSGYMLLQRGRAYTGGVDFEADVVHELYHVMQYAHIDGEGTGTDNWFLEASATWAEWAYVPAASASEVHTWYPMHYENADLTVFDRTTYQPGDRSLQVESDDHQYAAYIWPYFMQQQLGGRTAVVGNVWKASDFADNPAAIDRAIDRQLKFSDSFGDFIVRNLNATLPGDPLQVHFWDLDPNFPNRLIAENPVINRQDLPQYARVPLADGLQREPVQFEIDNLSERYPSFAIPADSGIGHVLFEFEPDGAVPPDVEAVAAVVNDDGTHTYKRFTAADHRRLEFCFANPQQHVDEIILAVGNHDYARGGTDAIPTMTGTMYVTTDQNCGEWTGTVTYTLKNLYRQETDSELGTAVDQTHEITTSTWTMGPVKPDPNLPIYQQMTVGWSVNDDVSDTYDLTPSVPCGSNTLHSSTSGTQGFGATVTYDIIVSPFNTLSLGPPPGTNVPTIPSKDWTTSYESVSCDGYVVTGDGDTRTLSDQAAGPISLYGPPGGLTADPDDPNHYVGTNSVELAPNVTATVAWDIYHNASAAQ
jgi:hypothetical protein